MLTNTNWKWLQTKLSTTKNTVKLLCHIQIKLSTTQCVVFCSVFSPTKNDADHEYDMTYDIKMNIYYTCSLQRTKVMFDPAATLCVNLSNTIRPKGHNLVLFHPSTTSLWITPKGYPQISGPSPLLHFLATPKKIDEGLSLSKVLFMSRLLKLRSNIYVYVCVSFLYANIHQNDKMCTDCLW